MVWFNVDDGFAFHHKALAAGNAAIGLWTRAGSWSCQTLTNGFVPSAIARSMGTPKQAQSLVDAGLWVKTDGGYRFHQWDQKQQTKEDVEAKREADRVRKADLRRRKNVPPGHPPDVQPDGAEDSSPTPNGFHAESERVSLAHVTRNPSQPNPSLPSSGEFGRGSHVGERTSDDPPPPRCSKHLNDPTDVPCRACGDARGARADWDRQHDRAAAEAAVAERKRQAEATRIARENCPFRCAETDGYRNGRVCDHNPKQDDTNAAGIAKARAVLAGKRSES